MKTIGLGRLLTSLFVLFTAVTMAQEPTKDTTSRIEPQITEPQAQAGNLDMLTPPATFEVSPAFNGYLSKKTSSAIIVTLIEDVTFPLLADGMTPEFYAENKLKFISESDVKTSFGNLGKMYKSSFVLEGDEFMRYMVFIGDLEKTLWLNITYPAIVEPIVEAEIIKCIDSVNLNPVRDEK